MIIDVVYIFMFHYWYICVSLEKYLFKTAHFLIGFFFCCCSVVIVLNILKLLTSYNRFLIYRIFDFKEVQFSTVGSGGSENKMNQCPHPP
jgi:hypothetical protein